MAWNSTNKVDTTNQWVPNSASTQIPANTRYLLKQFGRIRCNIGGCILLRRGTTKDRWIPANYYDQVWQDDKNNNYRGDKDNWETERQNQGQTIPKRI